MSSLYANDIEIYHIFTVSDVADAIKKLNAHKNDGNSNGLSTDH